jgi:predicted nucleic acid-binding Zn ribbon protein
VVCGLVGGSVDKFGNRFEVVQQITRDAFTGVTFDGLGRGRMVGATTDVAHGGHRTYLTDVRDLGGRRSHGHCRLVERSVKPDTHGVLE